MAPPLRPRCPVCGQIRSLAAGPDAPGDLDRRTGPESWVCPNRWCSRADRGFSVVFAASCHQGRLRRAITRYKYGGDESLAGPFAAMLARFVEAHATWFEEFDVLTTVPAYLGPGSRRRWDPVARLLDPRRARSGLTGGWDVRPDALVKTAETPPLAGLTWAERQRVASGPLRRALAVPDAAAIAGAQVLVLDDVFTEGSTLHEVGRALRRAGAADVAGLVLARPGWDEPPPLAGH